MDNIGAAIKFFLKQRNISIKQLVDETKISKSSLYDFLNGKHDLNATNFIKLLKHLDVNINIIIAKYEEAHEQRNIDVEYEKIKQLSSDELITYLRSLGVHKYVVVLSDFIVQSQYQDKLTDKLDLIQDVARELVFDKLDYYSVDEVNLFINLISISQNFNYIYGVYLDIERLFSRKNFQSMYRSRSEMIQQLLMLRFNMIIISIKHNLMDCAQKIIDLAKQLIDDVEDMYSMLLLRLIDVIELIIKGHDEDAEKLYDKLFSAMVYFLPPVGQFRFERLFLNSFEEFKNTFRTDVT